MKKITQPAATPKPPMLKSEDELRMTFGLQDVGCCDSCHDDQDHGLSDMCLIELPDGSEMEVCCTIANAYEDKIKLEKTPELAVKDNT